MKESNTTKTIFVIEIDVPAKEWSLGHLPRFHTMYVSKFLELGYRVFSISPDTAYVAQRISSSNSSQLIYLEHNQLLQEINRNVSTSQDKNTGHLKRLKNNKLQIKKYLRLLMPPVIYDWAESLWQKLQKIGVYHRHYCQVEFNKYQKYLNYLLPKYNLEKSQVLVFFPYLDKFFSGHFDVTTLDAILRYDWIGLVISLNIFNMKNALSLNQSKFFKGFGILEEDKLTNLQAVLPQKKVIAFPDLAMPVIPNKDYPLIKQIKWEAQGGKVIGLFGFSAERKGALNFLITSSLAAEKKLNNYFFVLAGGSIFSKTSTLDYLNRASAASNSLTYLSTIKNDEDFIAVLQDCDIIYAAYVDFPGSSNILAYAAYLKKPIIVSQGYLMEGRVRKYSIGLAIPQNDPAKCLEAIDCLLRGVDFNGNPLRFDFAGYTQEHSYENLGKAIELILSNKDEQRPLT